MDADEKHVASLSIGLALTLGLVACGADPTPAANSRPEHRAARSAFEGGDPEGTGPERRESEGRELLGTTLPSFGELEWVNSSPLSVDGLRGKVVLIRFWTETCPFCRASAPALRELDAHYRDEGLQVIGVYHPKPRGSGRATATIQEAAETLGWPFPVAIDRSWTTIDALWLGSRTESNAAAAVPNRRYTSASLLADREGTIRHVHPGPEFHPGGPEDHARCRADYAELRHHIERLVRE